MAQLVINGRAKALIRALGSKSSVLPFVILNGGLERTWSRDSYTLVFV